MSTVVRVEVPATGSSGRADKFVADASGISRAQVQRLISDGRVTRDGVLMRARDVLAPGAIVELDVPDPVVAAAQPETIPLDVIYQDDDLLIVDKPAGLVTHPSPGHDTGTLVNALLGMAAEDGGTLGTIAGIERAGIVHRLDRDTSGLLMVARTDAAQIALQAQLKAHRVHKRYLALVSGSVLAQVGRIEAPIGRDPRDRLRMAIVPDGKEAITGYRVRERFALWTLLELELITGRTHQIRVHLSSIGHPLAGDRLYSTGAVRRGPEGLERLFLHAWRLELASPSGNGLIRAESPLPPALESVLEQLRRDEAVGIS
ncbi:MAG: RluA family pseudouridine synthase [Chloroflexi bacterium]|nr:RluA family pseudouridine synthase [Chloroflexota bacterium]